MYINYHYPFPVLQIPNEFCCFLDKNNICIHYNLYKKDVEKLNVILSEYDEFKSWSLDELIFYSYKLPNNIKNEVIELSGNIYNHQVFFSSITNRCINPPESILKAIKGSFSSFNHFIEEFYYTALNFKDFGFVFMCIDENERIIIVPTTMNNTTIPLNLYPLMGIDLFEHSYYPTYIYNKKEYISCFLKYLNWNYINNEYLECIKRKTSKQIA